MARKGAELGENDYVIRVLGAPGEVPSDEWNALRVTTGDGRVFTARGRGAGRIPTTESVWADLTDLLA